MPNGHVKLFDTTRNFGFIVADDGQEFYVAGTEAPSEPLRSGDVVEFEVQETESGRKGATGITVTKQAPPNNPVGHTLAPPPSWEELEERERQRRMARRRRR